MTSIRGTNSTVQEKWNLIKTVLSQVHVQQLLHLAAPNGKLKARSCFLPISMIKYLSVYKWNMSEERTLVLEKSGVTFTFGRILKPQAASH